MKLLQQILMECEPVQNLLCMDSRVHALWNDMCFGLKPVSKEDTDNTPMEVELWWLKGNRRDPDMHPHGTKLLQELSQPVTPRGAGTPEGPGDNHKAQDLWGHGDVQICSGMRFSIPAEDNPNIYGGKPSWALLNLQWNLHCIAKMSGAADIPL